MSNRKIAALVETLAARTEQGKIDWEVTASSSEFLTALSKYSVVISERGQDFFITILDSTGDIIEQVSDPDLREELHESYKLMGSLFTSARRNARGADKAIDDILGSLEI